MELERRGVLIAMTEDRTYFTINLPQRCRQKLDNLAQLTMRSRPQVLEVLIEQGLRRPELVGVPILPETQQQRDSEQQREDAA